MGGIRFQVGVPRAGSAARSAEGEPRARVLGSLAGSAARAAEEAKRAAASGAPAAPTITMRAAGGKVFQPVALAPATAVESFPCSAFDATAAVPLLPVQHLEVQHLQVSAETQAEESSQPGVLQTAAARVHSLVRSLFGGQTRTP